MPEGTRATGRNRRRRLPGRPARSGQAELLRDADRAHAYLLTVDGVPQSHVDLDDPTDLEFDYVRWIADIVDSISPGNSALRALHLGGGAATLARYIAATRPGSRQLVAEIDDQLVDFLREELGLRVPGMRVRIVDGREMVSGRRPGSADLVVVDAFAGARLPVHLATAECAAEIARVLTPAGVHLLNVADGTGLAFARRMAATLAEAYEHVALLSDPGVLRGRRFGNLVLAGSRRPLPVDEIAGRNSLRVIDRASVLHADRLRRWYGHAAPLRDGDEVTVPLLPASLWP